MGRQGRRPRDNNLSKSTSTEWVGEMLESSGGDLECKRKEKVDKRSGSLETFFKPFSFLRDIGEHDLVNSFSGITTLGLAETGFETKSGFALRPLATRWDVLAVSLTSYALAECEGDDNGVSLVCAAALLARGTRIEEEVVADFGVVVDF